MDLKKGIRCHVCAHKELAAIDLGLSRGVPMRQLAERYGLSGGQHPKAQREPFAIATARTG